ncbi:MAG: sugar phosphate nucleotidyltransferase, partial [Ignavibacteria bacterium]|nr:sugar phosphate nucleotidyltransferase [Ignavibacteria bacterium]
AGGKATRLYPLTYDIPKSLLDIAGKPFIYRQFEIFKRNNIKKVVLCLGVHGKKIEDYIKGQKNFFSDFEIYYSYDYPDLLGTGGSVKNAFKYLGNSFFVIYGDSYLNINFTDVSSLFEISNKLGLMTVFKNSGLYDKSNVVFQNGKIIEYDKMRTNENMKYIDYGLGILNKKAFEPFKTEKKFDLVEVYKYLIRIDELIGYEVKERFYEIGSKKGLEELINCFKNNIFT